MKTWSASDYLDGDGKRYQCYAKVKNEWVEIGEPMPLKKAQAEVQRMRNEGRVSEPHFVPLR